jgi:hypothetical protein
VRQFGPILSKTLLAIGLWENRSPNSSQSQFEMSGSHTIACGFPKFPGLDSAFGRSVVLSRNWLSRNFDENVNQRTEISGHCSNSVNVMSEML